MGGCHLLFVKHFDFEQFSQRAFGGATGQEGFFAPPQGSRVVLCCHKAAGFFCGATEQEGFLPCHEAVWFLCFFFGVCVCAATGQQGYLSGHRVVSCCGACYVPAFCFFLCFLWSLRAVSIILDALHVISLVHGVMVGSEASPRSRTFPSTALLRPHPQVCGRKYPSPPLC